MEEVICLIRLKPKILYRKHYWWQGLFGAEIQILLTLGVGGGAQISPTKSRSLHIKQLQFAYISYCAQ